MLLKNDYKEKLKLLHLLAIKQRLLMPPKMRVFLEPKRFKFAWGGRWGSKSITFGKILLYYANKRKLRILCTREIQNSIAESVHADLRSLIYELDYDNYHVTDKNIINKKTGSIFIFKGLQQQDKKQTVKSLSNIDICWVEEAQTVSKPSLDILIPTIRKSGSEIWFSYNPFLPDDPVELLRQSIEDEEKTEVNILVFDNKLISKETEKDIERLKRQYEKGENQDYLHVVMGQPLGFSEYTIFKVQEIQGAIERSIDPVGDIVIGVDLARMGQDKTIFIKRKGLKMIDYKMYNVSKGDEVIRNLIDFVDNDINVKINIDETGIAGGYIKDIMLKKGFKNTYSINFGKSAKDQDKYNNAISEMWFEFKSIINDVDLMNIPELKSQLVTREYKYDNKERKCVEPKETYKKRGYKSPDFADAVLLCYYNDSKENAHSFNKRLF